MLCPSCVLHRPAKTPSHPKPETGTFTYLDRGRKRAIQISRGFWKKHTHTNTQNMWKRGLFAVLWCCLARSLQLQPAQKIHKDTHTQHALGKSTEAIKSGEKHNTGRFTLHLRTIPRSNSTALLPLLTLTTVPCNYDHHGIPVWAKSGYLACTGRPRHKFV